MSARIIDDELLDALVLSELCDQMVASPLTIARTLSNAGYPVTWKQASLSLARLDEREIVCRSLVWAGCWLPCDDSIMGTQP